MGGATRDSGGPGRGTVPGPGSGLDDPTLAGKVGSNIVMISTDSARIVYEVRACRGHATIVEPPGGRMVYDAPPLPLLVTSPRDMEYSPSPINEMNSDDSALYRAKE